MFTGNMNAHRLKQILQAGLVPFINEKFPDIFEEEGIFWWPTPPDLNPIELIWGSLEQYLCTTYKPRNLQDLKNGIEQFWITLSPEICQRYIAHIHKVIPKIVEVNGEPSGY